MDLQKEFRLILLIYIFIVAAFTNLKETIASPQLIPCEEGSYFFGERCYKMFGEEGGFTWQQASEFCRTRNGSLVTIDTKEIQDFLTTFLILGTKSDVWIGLHDRHEESVYMWDDGSVLNYSNWELKPVTLESLMSKDCVEMHTLPFSKMGLWETEECNRTKPFICQSTKSEETSSHDSRFCPIVKGGGWKYLNSCYHVLPEEKSWEDAEAYCQENFKGHLLTIFGPTGERFLNRVLPDVGKDFWIGIKIDNTTQLKWSSGWPVGYKNWSGEPTDFTNDTCVLKTKGQSWTSTGCLQKRSFICETSSDHLFILKEGWSCPGQSRDWIDLDRDKCYIIEANPLPWYQANYICTKKGGSLAVIESEEENKELERYVVDRFDGILIGLHRSDADEDVFEWVDGTAFDYQNWYPERPNNKQEKCGEIWPRYMMKWNDLLCSDSKPYICSAKKIPPTVRKEKETNIEVFSCQGQCNCSAPPRVMKEKETDVKEFSSQTQCKCSGYMSPKSMFMVLVGIFIFSLVVGLVIFNFKTYYAERKKHFILKDADVFASFRNPEDSSELITNTGYSECRL